MIFTNVPVSIHSWLNIFGDPTLRMKYIQPPTITGTSHIGSTVTLNWSAGAPGSAYYVYRAATPAGPFTLLTGRGTSFTTYSTTASTNQTYYMVRGVLATTTGLGSYANLSQGVTVQIP